MNAATLTKLERLLKRFPETWVHTKEPQTVDGSPKVFHHVDYRSSVEGKPRVRLVSHVSAEMCDLLVTLKGNASEFIALARRAEAAKPKKRRGSSESGNP